MNLNRMSNEEYLKLVHESLDRLVERVTQQERERCALVAESDLQLVWIENTMAERIQTEIARRIRSGA